MGGHLIPADIAEMNLSDLLAQEIGDTTGLNIGLLQRNFDEAELKNIASEVKSNLSTNIITALGSISIAVPIIDHAVNTAPSLSTSWGIASLAVGAASLIWASSRQKANRAIVEKLTSNTHYNSGYRPKI